MPRKSYKPEEIVAKLRQVDVLTSRGDPFNWCQLNDLLPLWTALPLQDWLRGWL